MEGYEQRLQYSVFRCWLTSTEVARLRWELTEKLSPDDDVMLMPLCSRYVDQIVGIHDQNCPPEWTDKPQQHIIV